MGILDVLPWRKQAPEQKQDYTEALLLPLQLSAPSFGRSYAQAVANSYEVNSIAHRAIRLIAENVSAVPWLLYRDDEPLDEHWVLESLRSPNPTMSGRMFKQTLAGDLVADGNAFILKIQTRPEQKAELHALRPDHVKVHPANRMGDMPVYEYKPPGHNPVQYGPEDICHIHSLDLLRSGRGFSSIYAAAFDLDQSNLGSKWNVSLLKNGGRPSMAVIAKSRLTPEQKQMLRDNIEELHAGAGNAGRVAVFSGADLDIRDLGFSPKDMDWKDGINDVNARIATALGVPPELLNLGVKSYQNKAEAKKGLYEDVIIPNVTLIIESLNTWLVPPPFLLDGYWEKVEALQPNRTDEYARLDKSVEAGWLTINDAREEAGFDPDPDFGALYRWQADAIAKTGRAGGESPEPNQTSAYAFPLALPGTKELEAEDEKVAYWKAQDQRKQSFEEAVAEDLRGFFDRERREIRDRLASVDHQDSVADAAIRAVDAGALKEVLEPAFLAVMEDFGDASLVELGLKSAGRKTRFEEVFGTHQSEVLGFAAENVAEDVQQVADTTKQQIREHVQAGIRAGESVPKLAGRVDDLYLEQIIPNRSTVIARTEVIKASNAGSFHAAKGTGLPVVKSWLATRDLRTRTAHLKAEADGGNQRIPIDSPFLVGGEHLMFPGDPNGSPSNVIQCRCTFTEKIDTSGAIEEQPPVEELDPYTRRTRPVRKQAELEEGAITQKRQELATLQDEKMAGYREVAEINRTLTGEAQKDAAWNAMKRNSAMVRREVELQQEVARLSREAKERIHRVLRENIDERSVAQAWNADGWNTGADRFVRVNRQKMKVGPHGGSGTTATNADEALEWFNKHVDPAVVGGNDVPLVVSKDPNFRAIAFPRENFMAVSHREQAGTIIHEMGHVLDGQNPAVARAVDAWTKRRTSGETAQKMSKLTGNNAYAPGEVARPDKFFDPYVGKDYGNVFGEGTSMGIETFFRDPLKFHAADPEHFDLIVSILNGTLQHSPYAVP